MAHPLLLVDDEEGYVRTLAQRLGMRDLPARVALTGEEALEELAQAEAEVVVLDINLPGRDGLEVLREIKDRWPAVEVLMLTGQGDVTTAVRGMKLGARDFLIKPVDIDALAGLIRLAGSHRLAAMESQRMIEAGKLAALGRLAEGMAHEIANPVNNLLAAAGIIEDALEETEVAATPQAEELTAAARTIAGNATRCKEILGKLYSLVGKVDPRKASLDVNAVVGQALEECRSQSGGEQAQLVWEPGELPPWRGAAAQLQLVCANLLANALESLPTTGGRIEVRTRHEAGEIQLTVEDNGRGIAADHLPHVFEPFYSTKPVGQGMGLGLSIAHAIVQSCGGAIHLDSHLGQGTRAWVSLPLRG